MNLPTESSVPLVESASAARQYRYRALYPDGEMRQGNIRAANSVAARERVEEQGAVVLRIAPDALTDWLRLGSRARGTPTELAALLRSLSTLLEAGVPVARAIEALPDVSPTRLHASIVELSRTIGRGESISRALRSSVMGIPDTVLVVLSAGERSGNTAIATRHAAELLERQVAMRIALQSALAYPVILVAVGLVSCAVLIMVVLPRFAELAAELGSTLPSAARVLIGIGAFTRDHGTTIATCAVVAVLASRQVLSASPNRTRWHRFLRELPILGALCQSIGTSRACAAMAHLLSSGVPIGTAIAHAATASGDQECARRMLAARDAVIAGTSLGEALGSAEAFTNLACGLVRTGERSGSLVAMLEHAARVEEARADHRLKALVRALEPGLILALGAIVAMVASAMLQTLYGVRVVP